MITMKTTHHFNETIIKFIYFLFFMSHLIYYLCTEISCLGQIVSPETLSLLFFLGLIMSFLILIHSSIPEKCYKF